MIPGGELRVTSRYWSNHHGAGRVTATARGVRRTVPYDHGAGADGSHAAAVRAVLDALNLAGTRVPDPHDVAGARRLYLIRTTTTTEETTR